MSLHCLFLSPTVAFKTLQLSANFGRWMAELRDILAGFTRTDSWEQLSLYTLCVSGWPLFILAKRLTGETPAAWVVACTVLGQERWVGTGAIGVGCKYWGDIESTYGQGTAASWVRGWGRVLKCLCALWMMWGKPTIYCSRNQICRNWGFIQILRLLKKIFVKATELNSSKYFILYNKHFFLMLILFSYKIHF